MNASIKKAAMAARQAGLTVLPTRNDGTKAPAVDAWREFTKRPPTDEEWSAFKFSDGLGIIAGRGIECWDFDDEDAFNDFLVAATMGDLWPVVSRIRDGYEDRTPSGGYRWLVR